MADFPTFIDGFEQFAEGIDQTLPLAGYTGGGGASGATGRRPGSTALLLRDSALFRTVAPNDNVMSVGAAIRFSGRGTNFLAIGNIGLAAGADGMLVMNDVKGQVIPAIDKFYYYEIELNWSTGEAKAWVNGKLDITAPLNGARPAEVSVQFAGVSTIPSAGGTSQAVACSVDDIYIHDRGRLGPIEVATQMADQDSSPQDWETSLEGQDPENPQEFSHAEIVGARPPEPLDRYIQSGAVGAEDRFTSSTELARDDVVKAVSMIALARVTRRTNQALLLNSGTEQVSTGELSQAFSYFYVPVPFTAGALASTIADDYMAVTVGDPIEDPA